MKLVRDIQVAIRSLFRFRTDAIINVVGLSVGITISIIVLLYVRTELNYDRHFSDYNDIYRVVTEGYIGDDYFNSAMSPVPLSAYLKNNFIQVDKSLKIVRGINKLVSYGDKKFNEDNFYYAGASFFSVFDIEIIKGEERNLLLSAEDIVVTQSTAKRYFGDDDPLGKRLLLDNGLEFSVKAVCEDFKGNSHFHCDFIASDNAIRKLYQWKNPEDVEEAMNNWLSIGRYTYIVAQDTVGLEKRLNDELRLIIETQIERFEGVDSGVGGGLKSMGFRLQAIKDIHLYSKLENELEPGSRYIYVVLFLSVAFFVLVITCLNFINLTTARASQRLREIGVRKLMGGTRNALFVQFVVEAVTYSFIALFIGLVLVELLLPGFNMLFDLNLKIDRQGSSVDLIYVTLLTFLVGVVSGLYPAISFSGYNEDVIFKRGAALGKKSMMMRGVLAGCQILVATFLVIFSLGMFWQYQYLNHKDMGFVSKNILVVERGHALGKKFSEVKAKLKSIPGVVSVSACKHMIGKEAPLQSFKFVDKEGERMVLLPYNYVDKDFFKTLQVNFVAGTMWGRTDQKMSHDIVVNLKAKEALGMSKPLGKKINYMDASSQDYGFSIVGVSKDFHFEPVQLPVRPLLLLDLPKGSFYDNLLIKISDDASAEQLVGEIKQLWKANTDNEPFEYVMMDELLKSNLVEEQTVLKMIVLFAILSLFVAWLGIRAFAAYVTELKMSDFEIKKILGASNVQVFNELFVEVGQFLITGVIVSIPLSFVVLQLWLEGFAYYSRIPVFVMFAVAVAIFGLSFLFVLIHSSRTIKVSPFSKSS
ncbi:ABC transporter permease [Plebeiibacterium marinum]|uniref:ABC transporter permease n=1 Tax=Plebeiibacterium marinum TaxID=2992111 RepID=A0AAE3SIS3_9BACT|nr:ABC transporter permease [Plebeiobacterium marinum]MCW3804980.1 ABC transporter permease [Plebeiobacterium marinum]